MQTMELVDIEDVYPYQENDVRMNPRDTGTKECQEYIGQLAEQFRYNKLNPGQPRVRPILYRDGGIYQIIDGECRYRAMLKLGTKKFYADVFDDLADAETARREAAKAMVETDAKRALTPEEMSRGVQTMLALDVPDEEVAAVARIDAGSVRKARRATRKLDDAAYDMTLDRLIAISEFEGDEEAVAKLRDCSEKEWRRLYEGMRAERDRKAALAAMVAEAEDAGATVVEETPEGYVAGRTFSVYNRDAFTQWAEKWAQGSTVLATQYGVTLVEPANREVDEEEQRRKQEQSDFYAAYEDARKSRRAWIGERVADLSRMRATARFLTAQALAKRSVAQFSERTGARVEAQPCALSVAIGYSEENEPQAYGMWHAIDGDMDYLYAGSARYMHDLLAAMQSDGYGLSGCETKALHLCGEAVKGENDER